MTINLISPKNNEILSLISELHQKFFEDGGNKYSGLESFDYMNLYAAGIDNSFPEGIEFKWETELTSVYILLSNNQDMLESKKILVNGNSFKLYNLIPDTKYYWQVISTDNTCFSEIFCFETNENLPRWIKASDTTTKSELGVTNVRDLGGWKSNGKKVKFEHIYRGSEFDDHIILTDYAKNVLLNDIKIKTDFDVRTSKTDTSPLGKDINYVNIPMHGAYERISEFKDDYKEMFKVFTKAENYPLYIHCWGGADRTGTLICLLLGILGVNQEDLFLEYELTSFSVWGPRSSNSELFMGLREELDKYGSDTDSINKKCENFVLSTGITQEEIETIRNILLE